MEQGTVSPNSECSILPAMLRLVMGQVLASGREVFVDRCEMIIQRLVKVLFHAVEHFGFLRLKLRVTVTHRSDAGSEVLPTLLVNEAPLAGKDKKRTST